MSFFMQRGVVHLFLVFPSCSLRHSSASLLGSLPLANQTISLLVYWKRGRRSCTWLVHRLRGNMPCGSGASSQKQHPDPPLERGAVDGAFTRSSIVVPGVLQTVAATLFVKGALRMSQFRLLTLNSECFLYSADLSLPASVYPHVVFYLTPRQPLFSHPCLRVEARCKNISPISGMGGSAK